MVKFLVTSEYDWLPLYFPWEKVLQHPPEEIIPKVGYLLNWFSSGFL